MLSRTKLSRHQSKDVIQYKILYLLFTTYRQRSNNNNNNNNNNNVYSRRCTNQTVYMMINISNSMECGNEHQSGRLEQLAESCLQLHNPEQSSRRFRANGGERQRSNRGQTRAQQGGRRRGHTRTTGRLGYIT